MRLAIVLSLLAGSLPAQSPGKLISLDEQGVQKLIASNHGKPVLLAFWATWCAPCRLEIPQLARLEERLQSKGLKLAVISADEAEQELVARRFLDGHKIQQPVYRKQAQSDEGFINAIDKKWTGALPAMFLYDRSGKLVRSFFGETKIETVEAEIRKL